MTLPLGRKARKLLNFCDFYGFDGRMQGGREEGRKEKRREGARKVLRATIKVLNPQKVSSMVSLRHVCLIWRGALCTPGEPLVYRVASTAPS